MEKNVFIDDLRLFADSADRYPDAWHKGVAAVLRAAAVMLDEPLCHQCGAPYRESGGLPVCQKCYVNVGGEFVRGACQGCIENGCEVRED